MQVIVSNIIAPSNVDENPGYPLFGSISTRVLITHIMNDLIKSACLEHNIDLLDIYNLSCNNTDKSLNHEISDQIVHIHFNKNYLVKNSLKQILSIK